MAIAYTKDTAILSGKTICACAVCREDIKNNDEMADHHVFDYTGDLGYIELAHRRCGVSANIRNVNNYWNYDRHLNDYVVDLIIGSDNQRGISHGLHC